MTVCRTLKKGIYIETNLDCANCDSKERVCTWQGECENLEPMTNDEWRRTCSAKEFSKWLEDKMTWAAQEQGTFTAKGWEMWLKQPHRKE